MDRRRLVGTDMDVSALGFGGAEIGSQANVGQVASLLNQALDSGLNVIDTARCYGRSEDLIGETVASRRKDYFLFTKCGHAEGTPMKDPDWSAPSILKGIERSLRRLRTEQVDAVFLHTCPEEVLRQEEAIEGLEQARDKGYTRYIGYSGDGPAALWAIQCGRLDLLETSVSIADQEALELLLPAALEKSIGVVAKRPIANACWRGRPEPPSNAYHRPYWERLQKLDYDFLKQDIGTAVEKALRFTLSVEGVQTAIVGTSRPGRWEENQAMLEKGPLSRQDFEAIRENWKRTATPDWTGLG